MLCKCDLFVKQEAVDRLCKIKNLDAPNLNVVRGMRCCYCGKDKPIYINDTCSHAYCKECIIEYLDFRNKIDLCARRMESRSNALPRREHAADTSRQPFAFMRILSSHSISTPGAR